MGIKFSELLNSQRLRPLWQSNANNLAQRVSENAPTDPKDQESSIELGAPEFLREPPHLILAELEGSLQDQMGASYVLLGHLLHPLRAAVAKLDPKAAVSAHPMQRASAGSVHELIDRLDDALTGWMELSKR